MQSDSLPDDIEPLVRGLCEAISSLPGLRTSSSCQGHTRKEIEAKKPYHGCSYRCPRWYVSFRDTGAEAHASIIAIMKAVGEASFFSEVHGKPWAAGVQFMRTGESLFWLLSGDGGHEAISAIESRIKASQGEVEK